jgi:hypothetical protein
MIRRCDANDFEIVWAIINDGARSYPRSHAERTSRRDPATDPSTDRAESPCLLFYRLKQSLKSHLPPNVLAQNRI